MSSVTVASPPSLKVVIPEDFPPFYYHDLDGSFQGVSYEVAVLVSEKLGYQLDITQLPNMRQLLLALESGQQDLSINLTETAERSKLAYFTQTPHVYESQHLIVRGDSNIEYNGDLKSLTNYSFGPIFGWTYGKQFDSATYLTKDYLNDSKQQLKGLLSGRYDIAVNNPQYFQETISSLGINPVFKVLSPALINLPVTMAISKKHPDAEKVINAFEQEIARFIQTPDYLAILQKYGFTNTLNVEAAQ
ncbi:transporter substrate-binding domain-containing protein [Methylophaga sp. OBS3]|nr:transporter substrate-binding domain-containing protein [Methylophaga sp. OBS3]